MDASDKEKRRRQSDEKLLQDGQLDCIWAIAEQRTGRRPSPATTWRWTRKGVGGGKVRLAYLVHGGQLLTTKAAFEKFLADQTAAHTKSATEPDVTDEDLRAEGLL